MDEIYLVWSNEHGGWWGPGRSGYVQRIEDAGTYTRANAIQICTDAMAGRRGHAPLNELPVRLRDVQVMLADFAALYPGIDPEPKP